MSYLIIKLINLAFEAYYLLLIIRILLSWIPVDTYHPIIQWIYKVTDPFLAVFRRVIPPLGGLDLSPIIAFIALNIIDNLVTSSIARILYTIGI